MSNSPTLSPRIESQLRRAMEIQKELDLRKALYAELDLILIALKKGGFDETEIDGMVLRLEDKFAEVNTGWTSAAVRRYDLKIEPKERVEKRTERAKRKIVSERGREDERT